MAEIPDELPVWHSGDGDFMYVALQTPGSRLGGDVHYMQFRLYQHADTPSRCTCDHTWLDGVPWFDEVTTMDHIHDDPTTGQSTSVYKAVLDAVPRVNVQSRETIASTTRDPGATVITNAPFMCTRCETETFGVLESDLVNHLGVNMKRRRTALANAFGVDINCLFFKTLHEGHVRNVVPIDLLPDVFSLFDESAEPNGARGSANVSCSSIVLQLERTIKSRVINLGLRRYGIARVAIFAEKVRWLVHLRIVTYSHVMGFLWETKEENRELRRQNQALVDAMRELEDRMIRTERRVQSLYVRDNMLFSRVETIGSAVCVLGNLEDPSPVGQLPGATLAMAALANPTSAQRRDQLLSAQDAFNETFRKVCAMTGKQFPSSDEISEEYGRFVAQQREAANEAATRDENMRYAEWHKVFEAVCRLTGSDNPSAPEIRAAFDSYVSRKRRRVEEHLTPRKRHHPLDAPGEEAEDPVGLAGDVGASGRDRVDD